MVMLFAGGIRLLPPDDKPTGMFKTAVAGPLWLGREGLAGDAQADRRVHGGPDKALHQYPREHYAQLAAAFPAAAPLLVPGSIGENLSAPGWDEEGVCIGDVFRLGGAKIQVSQPRSPCWKIDRRFAVSGMTRLIEETGMTGWYFRVLEEGEVHAGCAFELLERPAPAAAVLRMSRARRGPAPDADELAELAATPGLTEGWAQKLRDRRQSLLEQR